MSYLNTYLELRQKVWRQFELLVQRGVMFAWPVDVWYPNGINPPGLRLDTEGSSYFLANAIVANPDYKLHYGTDLIVGTNKVAYIDTEGSRHEVEPDSDDVYWLSSILDTPVKRVN